MTRRNDGADRMANAARSVLEPLEGRLLLSTAASAVVKHADFTDVAFLRVRTGMVRQELGFGVHETGVNRFDFKAIKYKFSGGGTVDALRMTQTQTSPDPDYNYKGSVVFYKESSTIVRLLEVSDQGKIGYRASSLSNAKTLSQFPNAEIQMLGKLIGGKYRVGDSTKYGDEKFIIKAVDATRPEYPGYQFVKTVEYDGGSIEKVQYYHPSVFANVLHEGAGSDLGDGWRLTGWPFAKKNGGTVSVTGTAKADRVTLTQDASQWYFAVNDWYPVSWPKSQVTGMSVSGSGGNDIIDFRLANIACTFYGGSGDDTITGGRGADAIYGGAGNDLLVGGPGSDLLLGEDGDDVLNSSDGIADTLDGGNGTDTFNKDAGLDVVVGE